MICNFYDRPADNLVRAENAELDSHNSLCFRSTWKKGHPICPIYGFFKLWLRVVKFYPNIYNKFETFMDSLVL